MIFFIYASCPLASASQTVLRVKFSVHFVSHSPSFGELMLKTNVFIAKRWYFNFNFVKHEPYEKMLSGNSISFIEVCHNIFFDFQNFESIFAVTLRVWGILFSDFECNCPFCIRVLMCIKIW